MLSSDEKDLVKAVAEGAVKAAAQEFPVYKDLLQPSVQETGKGLGALVKVALSPITGLVWGYEKIVYWLEQELQERLKDVPPEQVKTPDPVVAGPAIEAMRFLENEPDLRGMFANLIASSMKGEKTHPGYVEILKNISRNDAILLQSVSQAGVLNYCEIWMPGRNEETNQYHEALVGSIYDEVPDEFESSAINATVENLSRLGVIASTDAIAGDIHQRLFNKWMEDNGEFFKGLTRAKNRSYIPTNFGRDFASACIELIQK